MSDIYLRINKTHCENAGRNVELLEGIIWPNRFAPQRAAVHVHNERDIPASPDLIWAWLIHADLWPSWYPNSSNVMIEGGGKELRSGTKFNWKTFGVNLKSTVEEFTPPERLAWSAYSSGIQAYHAWLIQRTDSGCHVITEENQNGIMARMSNALRPQNTSRYHELWLEGLEKKARSGLPP